MPPDSGVVAPSAYPLMQGAPLPGRDIPLPAPAVHSVNGHALQPPWPEHMQQIFLALGCFWGAERLFWMLPGVHVTAVGYMGGATPNPTYGEVCSGKTGHTEAVLVVYDPRRIDCEQLLQVFWEGHNPTQGMRQGNDIGTQYRSAIYCSTGPQLESVRRSARLYQQALVENGCGRITTEIASAEKFYYAEDYHQQYLAKNPGGYCGLEGLGVRCPQLAAEEQVSDTPLEINS